MAALRILLPLLIALAVVAEAPPASAQMTPQLERFEMSDAPESLKQFVRGMPPRERRQFLFRIARLSPQQRRQFARSWDRLSDEQRAARRERWLREQADPAQDPQEQGRRRDEASDRRREGIGESLEDLRPGPGPRTRLRRALENWDDLTPAERHKVSRHLKRLRRVSRERRDRMQENREQWEGMDGGRRARLRARLRRFRALPAQAQEALVEKRFADRSEEERARILEGLRRGEPPH